MNRLLDFWKKFRRRRASATGQSLFSIGFLVGKQLILFFALALSLVAICVAGIGIGYFANIISHTDIPSETVMKTKIGQLNQTSSLLFEDGSTISEVQSDIVRRNVTSDEISNYVKEGLMATEDSNFLTHSGIVPKSALRAVLQELTGSSSQTGGSTITQQLVKQQLLSNEVTFARKAKEMLLALRLEKFFSKDEILTAYLNVTSFGRNSSGQNIAGIQAAAEGVFGKNASDLSLPQAAFLVGLPQSPYAYTPYTNTGNKKQDLSLGVERMKVVLAAMLRDDYISQDQYDQAVNYDITQDFIAKRDVTQSRQSYLYQAVYKQAVETLMKQQVASDGRTWATVDSDDNVDLYNSYYRQAANLLSTAGYKVYSTINKSIYDSLQSAASNNAYLVGQTYTTSYTDPSTGQTRQVQEPAQTGAVMIENETGKILGFAGGTNFDISETDHAFTTRRSPGSTIKPLLVYGPAFDSKIAYPATMLADYAIERTQPDGSVWRPTNADNRVSSTFLTAREALRMSMNNPTIHLYSALLAANVDTGSYMEKMGVSGIPTNEYRNEAAAVGGFSGGPTVAEQTSAYTTFANNGTHVDTYMIDRIEDAQGNVVYQHQSQSTSVYSEGAAYMIRSILGDSYNNGTTQYVKNYLNFQMPEAFGKTGTSDDYRDMWTIVSTPKVTLGQWSGYDNNYGTIHNVPISTDQGYAWVRLQQYFAQLLNAAHAAAPSLFDANLKFAARPATIVDAQVNSQTGTLAGEVDVNGTKVNVTGTSLTDLFMTDRLPFAASYNFSPGASDSDLQDFWNKFRASQQNNTNRQNQNNNNQQNNNRR